MHHKSSPNNFPNHPKYNSFMRGIGWTFLFAANLAQKICGHFVFDWKNRLCNARH